MKEYQNIAVRPNNLTAKEISSAETIVLFLCKGCIPALPKMNVPEYLVQAVAELLKKNDKLADAGNITNFAMLGQNGLQQIVISGFGGKDACKPNDLRKAAGETARVLKGLKAENALVIAPILLNAARPHYLSAMAEGLILGGYAFNECKGKPETAKDINYTIVTNVEAAEKVAAESCTVSGSVCYARDLANLPGNMLTPAIMAAQAQNTAAACGMECEVLDAAQLKEKGMEAILAVGQGSVNPPYMITLKYNGGGDAPYTAFVGKGITFDSGGISIKPEANMGEMKDDMTGAAVVLAAMQAIAKLKLPCNVMGILACAENMPSGSAQRPGDVVKAASGKTIEVVSTDAEGRMVLADAVWYACRQGAAKVIDIATLTGGVIVALGNETAGIVANNDELAAQVMAAGKKAGEMYWQLPSLPECKEAIKSDIADLTNSAGRAASCITGGLFIGEFIDEGTPWVHIDIGGTSTAEKNAGFKPKGCTAFGVRTLVNIAREL